MDDEPRAGCRPAISREPRRAVARNRRDHVRRKINGANAVVVHVGDVKTPVGTELDVERRIKLGEQRIPPSPPKPSSPVPARL
jgi:hypothetical protein